MSDKVLKSFDQGVFHGSALAAGSLADADDSAIDATARLREMW